ncbi:ABC transporter permease [Candidatus Gottesmanbacteria bacterium]|nr:ABC transporter permease [Candidatus Gottesmanbacteria bacterium]MBI5465084.1 ABC transporter permease [Candidatus Gottesmanbacteria bacterium]
MKLFKSTWRHIRRSPYQALAAVGIMTLTLFVSSIFFLTAAGSAAILSYFESKPQITAFFTDEKKEQEIKNLEEKLVITGQVAQVKYVSKEEALAIYREQNKGDPLLLEMVTANILPASLEVSAKDAKFLADLAKILQAEPGIEEVVYQKDVVDALVAWTGAIRQIGIILIGFLTIVSLLIILTVIGMKIALRREEIEILKLIGASNWYIRAPFLLEGAFYGGLGAIISWIISYLLLLYATPFLTSFLIGIPILPVSPIFMLALLSGLVLVGAGVGVGGSLLAVWRYLRA